MVNFYYLREIVVNKRAGRLETAQHSLTVAVMHAALSYRESQRLSIKKSSSLVIPR